MKRGILKAFAVAIGILRNGIGEATPQSVPLPDGLPEHPIAARFGELRHQYINAKGRPSERLAINREMVALAMQLRDAGLSRQEIQAITNRSLRIATHEAKAANNPLAQGLYFS
jgi:uncharacterized protein YjiS (DUF1127 family)